MNAKQIRDILIAYLTANNSEIRIYTEKSIGNSICDIMAVTDKLIGFEIKSDLDNYTRLASQIDAYDRFFNENYIVVGESHVDSVKSKVPSNWGIICIRNNEISIVRKATKNYGVRAKSQLSILWKLELKNILAKYKLAPYAQKDKGYITEQIAKYLNHNIVTKEVANELMHRDYSIYDATDYTVYSNNTLMADLPISEITDMLSESDFSRLTLDEWIKIYKQATDIRKKKDIAIDKVAITRNENAIPYTDIEVSLGVPWINAQIVEDFIFHILERPRDSWNYVQYEEITGNWSVGGKHVLGKGNANAEVKYGLKRYNALYIIEATLNLREMKLLDSNKKICEKDTLLALEKQRLINDEFKRWIWEDDDRKWMVENAYNDMFSTYDKRKYDGSALSFPNMSESFQLYPYQKDAVYRITQNKNTLLAFDVGAGKTYIMIAAAMNMRVSGMSRKNMFVVPNHIVGQWEKIFSELYPNSKILAIEPKAFKPEMRGKVLRQIRDGDYDGIIIAYSCFEMIPLSGDAVINNMNRQLEQINEALKNYKNSYNNRNLYSAKSNIIKLTNEFINSMEPQQNDSITFDELEISTLFLDEAHNYKNLPIKTRLTDLRGINIKGSHKCLDMLHKIRTIQSSDNGRGAVFATGTPLCNSISDAYAMQVYLQYDELKKSHLDVFDNWVKTFARPEQVCEIDVDTSKYRFVRRFAKFFNLPELSKMFSQVADFHANTDQNNLPAFSGYTDVSIEKSENLHEYMLDISERTEAIRSGKVDRHFDNMLKVSTDGRKAALDLSLVGKTQPYDEYSKIYRCVNNTVDLYNRYPETTQLIFCDYSTPKPNDFNVYSEIKRRLIEYGIPQKQIVFIHNYNTESRKVELFRKFNSGEVRILIGSTFKLGIGANVQVKLKAIHHLDVPWRPADMVQREGRIIRQGNQNDNVLIYRYITKGSFDAYSWQILETKQNFISQFLSGSSYQRSTTDLENNVLNYAQVKALALSQPLMKLLAEKENEAKELHIFIAKEAEERHLLKEELDSLTASIPQRKYLLSQSQYHLEDLNKIGNTVFAEEMKRLSTVLTTEVVKKQKSLPYTIKLFGFTVDLPEVQNEKKPYAILHRDDSSYIVELGDSATGNARRIIGTLKHFSKFVKMLEDALYSAESRIKQIEKVLSQKHSYQEKLCLVEKEVDELKTQIAISND